MERGEAKPAVLTMARQRERRSKERKPGELERHPASIVEKIPLGKIGVQNLQKKERISLEKVAMMKIRGVCTLQMDVSGVNGTDEV